MCLCAGANGAKQYQIGQKRYSPAGSGPASPFRCSAMQSSSWATYNQPICSGAQVGDLAVIFATTGLSFNTYPSGWTVGYANNASCGSCYYSGFAAWKVLSSGDISTGYVTIAVYGGSYYGETAIAVLIGDPGPVRESEGNDIGNATTTSVSTTSGVLSSDIGVFFSGIRPDTTGATVGISPGTNLKTAQSSHTGGTLAGLAAMSAGVNTIGFNFSPTNSGNGAYDALVIIE